MDIKIKSGTKTASQKMLPISIYNKMESDIADKSAEVAQLKEKVIFLA